MDDSTSPVVGRELVALAAVVVLGAIMTILDATIVNVALPTLGRQLHASIATIQWVPTIYLLAFATVIPLTAWAGERYGAKRVWIASLCAFLAGSLLCGVARSVPTLLAARVVQGLGGGMILPLGQAMLALAAGPRRMGRVMTVVGVPMLLAPIVGPVIGGAIVAGASWRWIFFVNLPVGALALVLAAALLPSTPPRRGNRLDARGLALLATGIAALLYGLAELTAGGTGGRLLPLICLGLGAGLIAAFGWHATRAAQPLLDVRLLTDRAFGAATATNLALGIALFGVALLLPLYYQIVRGLTPLQTGLLLIPQGAGAALAMPVAGRLTDRIGGRPVVVTGVVASAVGVAACARIAADTPYWWLCAALLVVGAGLGSTITPAMAVGFAALDRAALPRASSAISVTQRIAGSIGTAVLAGVLQAAARHDVAGYHGDIGAARGLARSDPGALPAFAHAFATAFWVALALTSIALLPALLLPRRDRRTSDGRPTRPHDRSGVRQAPVGGVPGGDPGLVRR